MSEGTTERRLAAIVAIDVAGYSRLMGADEVGTLATLKAHQEAVTPLVQSHGGRIVGTAGDGLLLEFPSVVEAVTCSIAVQAVMAERNADIPDDQKMLYRIGINSGDVLISDDDIFGDGVNVAARIEALAEPGGICVARTVRNQVRDKIDITFEDMGEVEVKNIARPVKVFRVLKDGEEANQSIATKSRPRWQVAVVAVGLLILVIGGGGGWWWLQQPEFEPADPNKFAYKLPDKPSIAVLPFDYLGVDKKENDFLADGMSENIIASLTYISELLVIARNSTFIYKNEAVDIREVSERFGVRYVLEGSVQKSDDRLRITAQLIDAVSGKHIWAETYDRPQGDIFAVQDEITLAIAQNILHKTVTGGVIKSSMTKNLAAWKAYQKGKEAQYIFTKDKNKEAKKYFSEALELDPKYYEAMSFLAFSHIMDARLGFSEDRNKSLQNAEELLVKALTESPDKATVYRTMASLRLVQKNKKEALEYSRKAQEAAPGDAEYFNARGWINVNAGKPEEAIGYFAEANRLQPVRTFYVVADEYRAYMDAGRYSELVGEMTDKFIATSPKPWLHVILATAAVVYSEAGKKEKANELLDQAYRLKPDLSLQDLAPGDMAYIEDKIRQSRKAKMRQLGIPEFPPGKEPTKPTKPSIAVLPFENSGDDKRLKSLAHGFTDDIIFELSRFKDLSVVGREAINTLRDTKISALETGRQLTVRYLVTGSLRRSADDVRMIVNLVDVKSGRHVWNDKFDFNLQTQDYFAAQDATVGDIVAAVGSDFGALTKARYAVARGRSPETFTTYECVLQAQRFFDTFSPKEFGPARDCLERTVKVEPEYAVAWAWLGGIYQEQVATGFDPVRKDSLDQARRAIDKALTLAPNNQQAHLFLAEDHFHRRKLAATIEVAERGIALNPNNTGMVMTLGFFIALAGNCDRGLDIVSEAVERIPGLPSWRHIAFIKCLFESGKHNEVVRYVDNLPAVGPNEVSLGAATQNIFKIASLVALEKHAEAKAFAQQVSTQNPMHVPYWQSVSRYWYEPSLVKEIMSAAEQTDIWPLD